jgi:hypothetical protein
MRIKCATVYGIIGSEVKEKFAYEGGEKTSKPLVDVATGLPQWGCTGLVYLPEADEFTAASIRVPAQLAEQVLPGAVVVLKGEHLVADMRGGQFSQIIVTVSGVGSIDVRSNFRDTVVAIEREKAAK